MFRRRLNVERRFRSSPFVILKTSVLFVDFRISRDFDTNAHYLRARTVLFTYIGRIKRLDRLFGGNGVIDEKCGSDS